MYRSFYYLLEFLPPPFNTIGNSIHENSKGSEKIKSNQVINYLNVVRQKGYKHYDKSTSQLDNILREIDAIEPINRNLDDNTPKAFEDILIKKR